MKLASVHAAFLLVLLAAGGLMIWRSSSPTRALRPPVTADGARILLPDAALLVTLDLEALGRSEWGKRALAELPSTLAGSGVGRRCAAEQLERVRSLALAVPTEEAGRGFEVGLVADGAFEAEETAACAAELVTARGGEVALSRLNDFDVVRDRRGGGELAIRDGGPLILSGGTFFRELVERVAVLGERKRASEEEDVRARLHAALRARAGEAPLLATWVLAPGWLERWLAEPQFAASPLARIRTVVVRGEADQRLRIRAELSVEDDASAEQLRVFAGQLVRDFGLLTPPAHSDFQIVRDARLVRISFSIASADPSAWLAPLGAKSHPLGGANSQELETERQSTAGGAAQ
ncbi:MAG TPA: hypothetical protein VIM73_05680 [Polyangiaceae bacterium]